MLHILIVDDDSQIQKAYKVICEKQDWTVTIARDGQEALELLDSAKPDVILLDIIMPRMNGIEFLKHVHDEGKTLPPTIIMTNSLVSTEAKEEAESLGVTSYNLKTHMHPTDIVEMVKKAHEK